MSSTPYLLKVRIFNTVIIKKRHLREKTNLEKEKKQAGTDKMHTEGPDPAAGQPVWVDEVVDECGSAQEPRQGESKSAGTACTHSV